MRLRMPEKWLPTGWRPVVRWNCREIGSLLLEFSSEGFDDPADFRPESLRGVRLRFYPSRQLMKAIKSQLNISLPE